MYTLTEVDTPALQKEFLLFPVRLYKNEKNWIRPLDEDIENVFNPSRNKLFRHGELIRWILTDEKKQTIGRIAAFIDRKSASKNDQPTGGAGFFECVNDQEAANILFDAAKNWLAQRGMEAMDGPVNFGERDRWWGLLVEGFEPPNYCMPYNFTYYKQLFENFGFKNYFNQYTYHRKVSHDDIAPAIFAKAERVLKNPDYTVRQIDKKKAKKFAADFTTIYNKGWGKFGGVPPITNAQAEILLKSLYPVMDERLILYMYYRDEPVAFFVTIPEINPVIKRMHGKMHALNKLRFAWYLKFKPVKKMLGLIFGIVPEHQGKGLESALIMKFADIAWSGKFPYTDLEMNWIGDFNPAMMKMVEQIGGHIKKIHVTYRYLFDPKKEFQRAPVVNRRERKNQKINTDSTTKNISPADKNHEE